MKLSKYYVEFEYNIHTPNTIECFVYIDKERKHILLYDSVSRYYKDSPNRLLGRKRALAKTIASLPKEERTAIWKDYIKQCKV
jgi:hypothetical protein